MKGVKLDLTSAILSTLCAVLWSSICFRDVMAGVDDPGMLALRVVTAVLWTIGAALRWIQLVMQRRKSGRQ